jgi:ComF family protein
MHSLLPALNPWWHWLKDVVFPPRCLICDLPLEDTGSLCREHYAQLKLVDEPCCRLCGFPFEFTTGENILCGECMHNPPSYDTGRTVMHYDSHSRRLVTRLKYSDRTDLAVTLAPMLQRAGREFLSDTDLLLPVPLHWRRMLQRKYNQSGLLAGLIGDATGIPVLHDGLERTRHTPQQAGLDLKQRRKNVKRAFVVRHRHAHQLAGKHVCLIDDVITTGSTIEACCLALKQARVAKIYVLSMARTIRGHS